MKSKLLVFLMLVVAALSANVALAWDTTRSSGPLVDRGTSQSLIKDEKDEKRFVSSHSSTGIFSQKVVTYPYAIGARLGEGWDFISDDKTYGSCINFGTASDKYQQLKLDYEQAIDEETLSVILNYSMSGKANGTIKVFTFNAESRFSLESSFKYNSTDEMIVARLSVVNGADFVVSPAYNEPKEGENPVGSRLEAPSPLNQYASLDTRLMKVAGGDAGEKRGGNGDDGVPNIQGVTLKEWALRLANKDPLAFRAACGDGFVASLNSGADLYFLYKFHHMDRDIRVKVTTFAKAGGGFGKILGGEAQSEFSTDIDNMIKKDRLAIYYVQSGGRAQGVITKKEEIATRMSAVPGEAASNGRPLTMLVIPYSVLPNYPTPEPPDLLDYRTSLIRYYQRMISVFHELQSVREDAGRDRDPQNGGTDAYLLDYTHQLRNIDLDDLNDQVLAEIQGIADRLRVIDTSCPNGIESQDCKMQLDKLDAAHKLRLDDYYFLMRLPVPRNELNDRVVKFLSDTSSTNPVVIRNRQLRLTLEIYRHWVARPSSLRCQLFLECMSKAERYAKWRDVLATFTATPPAPLNATSSTEESFVSGRQPQDYIDYCLKKGSPSEDEKESHDTLCSSLPIL